MLHIVIARNCALALLLRQILCHVRYFNAISAISRAFRDARRADFVISFTFPAADCPTKANCAVAHRSFRDPGVIFSTMSAKYYTQFRLTDGDYHGGNEFSGVVELSRPMDQNSDVTDIEAVLAKNFDLQQSAVQLVSWSRLH
jgi:hypothetical protein